MPKRTTERAIAAPSSKSLAAPRKLGRPDLEDYSAGKGIEPRIPDEFLTHAEHVQRHAGEALPIPAAYSEHPAASVLDESRKRHPVEGFPGVCLQITSQEAEEVQRAAVGRLLRMRARWVSPDRANPTRDLHLIRCKPATDRDRFARAVLESLALFGTEALEEAVRDVVANGESADSASNLLSAVQNILGRAFKRVVVRKALSAFGWNLTHTAHSLGLADAASLTRVIKESGLEGEVDAARAEGKVHRHNRWLYTAKAEPPSKAKAKVPKELAASASPLLSSTTKPRATRTKGR